MQYNQTMLLWENKKQVKALLERVCETTHSDFYAQKYTEHAISDAVTLENVPLLSREELVGVSPDERCYVQKQAVRFVAYTSGTTSGNPLLTYFSDVDNYFLDPAWGMDVSRLLVVFPPLNKNFGGTFIQQCAQAPRPVTPVFADVSNLPNSAYLAAATGCDALYATPSLALELGPYIKKYYDPQVITLLVISGETIGASKLASLQALYPKAKIANLYASSEIGQFIMGPTKQMLADGVMGFRLITDAVAAAELVDGEFVVTYGLNTAFPLIRYKTGDYFSVSESMTAQYGEGVPVLEWAGKGGVDVFRQHGIEIRTGSVDDFFGSLSHDVAAYQLHIYPGNSQSSLEIQLECVLPEGTSGAAVDLIRARFLESFKVDSTRTMHDAIADEVVDSFTVLSVPKLSHEAKKRRVLVNHA